jgi:hypothetical protein
MKYRQVSLSRDINHQLRLSFNNKDTVDRVYRDYKPTSSILSIPVEGCSDEEKLLTVKLEHGVIDMITATRLEVTKEIAQLTKYLLELDTLQSTYTKELL